MIKWNEVTWYSRLGALILFLAVIPALSFYIGTQYELIVIHPTINQALTILPSKIIQPTSTSSTTSSIIGTGTPSEVGVTAPDERILYFKPITLVQFLELIQECKVQSSVDAFAGYTATLTDGTQILVTDASDADFSKIAAASVSVKNKCGFITSAGIE
jgi:hypothetical protein